jgi:hypothetical protein
MAARIQSAEENIAAQGYSKTDAGREYLQEFEYLREFS